MPYDQVKKVTQEREITNGKLQILKSEDCRGQDLESQLIVTTGTKNRYTSKERSCGEQEVLYLCKPPKCRDDNFESQSWPRDDAFMRVTEARKCGLVKHSLWDQQVSQHYLLTTGWSDPKNDLSHISELVSQLFEIVRLRCWNSGTESKMSSVVKAEEGSDDVD